MYGRRRCPGEYVRGGKCPGENVRIPNDHWIVHYTVGLSVPPSVRPSVCYQNCEHDILTRSSAVAKRPRDASCLYSFNTKRRAQSFIISCFGFRYTTAYN